MAKFDSTDDEITEKLYFEAVTAMNSQMTPSSSKTNSFNGKIQNMYKRNQNKKDGQANKLRKLDQNDPEQKDIFNPQIPTLRLSDLGLMDSFLESLLELVALPLLRPDLYISVGATPIRGILLHGPPGCGKTILASALAGELNVPLFSIAAPSIVSGMSGESERTLRELFAAAKLAAPCIVLLDEIDSITPTRESAQREMEKRIVSQLLSCLDDLDPAKNNNKSVIVIGATNRPDSIDSAFRRPGRFDRELVMGVPDSECRKKILLVLTKKMKLSNDCNLLELANITPGYVGADLSLLACEAGIIAVKRAFRNISDNFEVNNDILPSFSSDSTILKCLKSNAIPSDSLDIKFQDFIDALKIVQPSSKRQGFATVPAVKWDEIGALQSVREQLYSKIVNHIKYPDVYHHMGIPNPEGILLWGPPGCGKTLLAKAMAGESHSNFISVKGPELLNKYVGESERAVRQVFARARASAPCVIFFDEIDAIAPKRDDARSEASARVVNTLLTELDGLESRNRVYIIGATNRPDIIDPAVLRPGRLGVKVYVGLPSPEERGAILKTVARKTPIDPNCNIEEIGASLECDGFSGADLHALLREATLRALDDFGINSSKIESITVKKEHFDLALKSITPSVRIADHKQ